MDFDQYSTSYRKAVGASISYLPLKHDFFTRVKANHFQAAIELKLGAKSDPEILDLGCGGGLTDELLKKRFPRLAGLDVSAGLLEQARLRNPELAYHFYDGVRSDLPTGSFDVVFAICVWHHVPVTLWPGFASEAARLLRAGGLFCVYEHNPINPLTRLSVARCEFDTDAVLLSAGRVRRLAADAGFSHVQTDYLLFLPFDRLWARALEKRLLRALPLGAQYSVMLQKSADDPRSRAR